MNPSPNNAKPLIVFACSLVLALAAAGAAFSHCDSLDGPIVSEALAALDSGDPTPVLKWVRAADEADVREAFARARAVRGRDADVRQLADRYFLETLVRVHRQGEGAPYTGLKPAGHVDPTLVAADAALATGDVAGVADELSAAIGAAIRAKFASASMRRQHAGDSVAAGREYVEAYVQFIHLVERLHQEATGQVAEGEHHGEE